jgi:cytochrome d ubiquinol oxidase subunit II
MSTFWFATLGVIFALYFVLGGLDYGVALLLPTLRGEPARRAALNAIGPMFLGNEVWVVAAAGVLLAAFPGVESGLFNGTYPVLMVLLLGLVAINAAVQIRGRADRRAGFDAVITGSGFVLAVGWGIVLSALLRGLPLTADGRVTGFAHLFGPTNLLFGLTTGVLALVQGATFLNIRACRRLAIVAAGLVALVLVVDRLSGPALILGGLLIVALIVVALTGSFLASSVASALPVLVVGTAVFPAFLVSTVDPAGTITVASGASGDHALQVLTIAAVPLLPLLVLAQVAGWWYFRRRPAAVYW